MFAGLAEEGKRLEEKVFRREGELQSEKERTEELRNKNENMTMELNGKDVEMNEMAAEVSDLGSKFKEMSVEVDSRQQTLCDKEISEEMRSSNKPTTLTKTRHLRNESLHCER